MYIRPWKRENLFSRDFLHAGNEPCHQRIYTALGACPQKRCIFSDDRAKPVTHIHLRSEWMPSRRGKQAKLARCMAQSQEASNACEVHGTKQEASNETKEALDMIRPGLEEIKALAAAGEYKTVPVSTEILSDIKTPIEVLRILKNVSGHCYMLESVAGNEKWGRYTFLGYDPGLTISCTDGNMKIGSLTLQTKEPGKYIRQVVEDHKSPVFDYLPSFTGGLVGYFSYDYLKYAEPTLRLDAEDTEGFQDVDLMLFDKVIAFDNFRQKIILIVNMPLENADAQYNKAVLELKHMAELIRTGEPCKEEPGHMTTEVKSLFSKEQYCEMVNKAKHHILEGDIFQIVLSNRLEAGFEGSLLNTYRVLRTVNPSPYMFYFSSSDLEVAGASPETLVRLAGRDQTERKDRGGGSADGNRTPGRSQGTGGTQYAGGSGKKRSGKDQPFRNRGGREGFLHRAVFPCNAHRVYGTGRYPGREDGLGCHRCGASRGNTVRSA